MKVINLFGGPGTGKSTTAAGLFCELKKNNIPCELVHEYAKELTYGEDNIRLGDQFLVSAQQHHKLRKLDLAGVDFAIADSPLVMGLVYYYDDGHLPEDTYKSLVHQVFNSYDNINIFLKRDVNAHYEEYGRNQTLEQAQQKDEEIYNLLFANGIPFHEVTISNATEKEIIEYIKSLGDLS